MGVPLLGIVHDWTKFTPTEWFPYVKYFYQRPGTKRDETGYYKPHSTGAPDFDFAFFMHQKRNKHHWQYWLQPVDADVVGFSIIHPMPDKYRREMLADWRGAGKAQGTPNTEAWYRKNGHKIKLHPETREWIEKQLNL